MPVPPGDKSWLWSARGRHRSDPGHVHCDVIASWFITCARCQSLQIKISRFANVYWTVRI